MARGSGQTEETPDNSLSQSGDAVQMNVARWNTQANFFSWPHVQRSIDSIDSTVYRAAIEFAQKQFLAQANSCPKCGRPAAELFWFSVSDSEAAWDEGHGRVGFLTICERCEFQ